MLLHIFGARYVRDHISGLSKLSVPDHATLRRPSLGRVAELAGELARRPLGTFRRMVRVVTSRLVLRALTLEDVGHIVALDADPEVREFLEMPEPTSREQALDWLNYLASQYPEGSERGFWAAEEDGQFVGWFHLRPSRSTGECELGYRLRRDAWGRGLATEGSRALLDLAGERVIASTMKINVRSRRVMEKLGMKPVREFAYSGSGPLDDIEYATP